MLYGNNTLFTFFAKSCLILYAYKIRCIQIQIRIRTKQRLFLQTD